jgi:AbrB family looped-hinge helix DNA binding protein
MQMRTRLDSNGRIVLPAAVRYALGLRPGDELIVDVEGREIRLVTVAEAARRAQELVRRYVDPGESLAESLVAERRRGIEIAVIR